MCKAMEELREESFQRGIDQSRLDSIKSIMETLKYTAQQAMDLLKIPVAEQSKYIDCDIHRHSQPDQISDRVFYVILP